MHGRSTTLPTRAGHVNDLCTRSLSIIDRPPFTCRLYIERTLPVSRFRPSPNESHFSFLCLPLISALSPYPPCVVPMHVLALVIIHFLPFVYRSCLPSFHPTLHVHVLRKETKIVFYLLLHLCPAKVFSDWWHPATGVTVLALLSLNQFCHV